MKNEPNPEYQDAPFEHHGAGIYSFFKGCLALGLKAIKGKSTHLNIVVSRDPNYPGQYQWSIVEIEKREADRIS